MTDNHTPGPWEAVRGIVKFLDHGRWYTLATVNGPRLSIEGKQANARLIAEAPAMLEVLKGNLEQMQKLQDSYLLTAAAAVTRALLQKRIDATRAILDRVEGRV